MIKDVRNLDVTGCLKNLKLMFRLIAAMLSPPEPIVLGHTQLNKKGFPGYT